MDVVELRARIEAEVRAEYEQRFRVAFAEAELELKRIFLAMKAGK